MTKAQTFPSLSKNKHTTVTSAPDADKQADVQASLLKKVTNQKDDKRKLSDPQLDQVD